MYTESTAALEQKDDCMICIMAVRTGMEKGDGSRLRATKAAKASVNFLSQNLFASDDARILTGMVSDTKKIYHFVI